MSDEGPVSDEREEAGGESLRLALRDLRREIRERFPEEESELDWMSLFDELRRRAGNLGIEEYSGEIDEFGMSPEAVLRVRPLLEFLRRRWWRTEVVGLEEVPEQGPVLFVANRSGLLPWDGLMLAHLLSEARPAEPRPRFLVADWLITLPFAQSSLARLGGVRACRENAERLLHGGSSVIAFPEGAKGAAKVFRERYRLKRFGRGGVVRLALAARVPIVPVAVIGAEEAHPILFKVETLARGLGLPFLPVTPTFPWLGPLGALPLPAKWSVHFGSPILAHPEEPGPLRDELLVSRMTEELRAQIQAMVDEDLHRREGVFA